jgi:hypothetical protein
MVKFFPTAVNNDGYIYKHVASLADLDWILRKYESLLNKFEHYIFVAAEKITKTGSSLKSKKILFK